MNAKEIKALKSHQLTLARIVRREVGQPFGDERRRMNIVTAEYRDSNGDEYRKCFESYDEPVVPVGGANSEITKQRKQW